MLESPLDVDDPADRRARLQSAIVLLLGLGLFLALPFVLSIGSVVFLPPVTAMIFPRLRARAASRQAQFA